jgi:hypothetical protein
MALLRGLSTDKSAVVPSTKLMKQEAKIGWDKIFHGRIVKAWRIPILGTY